MKRRKPAPRREHTPAPPAHSIAIPAADAMAPAESLEEAESELGINDWIDPDTGEPAEGQSPPRLQEE